MLSTPLLLDAPPESDQLTESSSQAGEGTSRSVRDRTRDAMTQLIGDDAKTDPGKAKTMYDSHLARAHHLQRESLAERSLGVFSISSLDQDTSVTRQ
jgi:hypothetical protein